MKTEIIMELIKMLSTNNEATTSNEATSDNSEYPIGKKIIMRGYDSGVLFGTLVSVKNGVYRMKDSRRLYYWYAKSGITLEDVAVH